MINGAVVARNSGRGRPIYDFSPFVGRVFSLQNERMQLDVRAEAFNVFNHANFVGYSGTYGNGPGPGFGQPLAGITNQMIPRELQFYFNLMFSCLTRVALGNPLFAFFAKDNRSFCVGDQPPGCNPLRC